MRRPTPIAVALLAILAPRLALSQQAAQPAGAAKVPVPVLLDTTGMFQGRFASVGDDFFVAGQPTERGLGEMKARGVTTVVNLRMPDEMQRAVKFDEPALVAQLGMKYLNLPVRGGTDHPYAPETLARFTETVRGANGKVLLHCTSAWRASHLWAAYLIQERGVPVEEALANARAINLMDAHLTPGVRQPVEDFLNRDIPTLGKAPPM